MNSGKQYTNLFDAYDLNDRANNTSGKAEDFYAVQIMESGKEFRDFYKDFCTKMGLNFEKDMDILKV